MVLAYHIIISVYGFWLPNDPRGSWSEWVRSWELFRYGPATKVITRHSLANRAHDHELRAAAKAALKYTPVSFTGIQAHCVAMGFERACNEAGYVVLACTVLPDHVHMVVLRDGRKSEAVISHMKRAASRQLREQGLHPFKNHVCKDGSLPSPWARNGWKVYLDSKSDIYRAIKYVEDNPLKEGKRRQSWSFVTPYVHV